MGWINRHKLLVAGALLLLGVLAFVFESIESDTGAGELDADSPKLVVLVVFDQMRGDYIGRWQTLFEEGGFNRLAGDLLRREWQMRTHGRRMDRAGNSTADDYFAHCPPGLR